MTLSIFNELCLSLVDKKEKKNSNPPLKHFVPQSDADDGFTDVVDKEFNTNSLCSETVMTT